MPAFGNLLSEALKSNGLKKETFCVKELIFNVIWLLIDVCCCCGCCDSKPRKVKVVQKTKAN